MEKKIKIPCALEYVEQMALVTWLKHHRILKDYVIKIDNEGKRTPRQGVFAKQMGMHPGASDIFIAYPSPNGIFAGLFLEMKRNKQYTPSERQKPSFLAQSEFISTMRGVGYCASFCYGFEDAVRIVENYMKS